MSTYTPEAFILRNQLVVTDTTDAVNGTSGAFVIAGGVSVSKSFFVSGDQSVKGQSSINNVNVTPNLNDIIYEKQAVLSSDVSSFTNITGFYFLDSIASAFKAYITVIVTGPTNKYAFWEFTSVYTPSGWAYTSTFTGDISGVNFSIYDNEGTAQVQYTNNNGAGYSTIIRYRAQTTAPAGSSPTGGTGLFNSTTNNYIPNTLLFANTSDTVASASEISFSNNILNVGGATKMIVSKTTDAVDISNASFVVSGGVSIAKKLLVGTKIGINTTNPGYNLDINGDINIVGDIYKNGSIYSGSSLWAGDGQGNYYINPIGSFVGINTTAPSTNLHVSGGFNATTATIGTLVSTFISTASLGAAGITVGSLYITNASSTNATIGSVKATNITTSNIHTDAGTLGPFIIVQQHYVDVTSGSHAGYTSANTIVFSEDGNPGINSSIGFNSGFGRLSDGSDDGITWNSARLVIRGASLNTGTSNSTIVLQPFAVQSSTGVMFTQASFTVTDNGSDRGYTTWISPWFSTNIVNDIQSIGIKALSINGDSGGNIRIGTTYMQFKS